MASHTDPRLHQAVSTNRIDMNTAPLPIVATYISEVQIALSNLLISVDKAAACDKVPLMQLCDELEVQRQEIAWQVTERASQSQKDICAKATILRELVGEEETDIADQLARSLCDDTLRLGLLKVT